MRRSFGDPCWMLVEEMSDPGIPSDQDETLRRRRQTERLQQLDDRFLELGILGNLRGFGGFLALRCSSEEFHHGTKATCDRVGDERGGD